MLLVVVKSISLPLGKNIHWHNGFFCKLQWMMTDSTIRSIILEKKITKYHFVKTNIVLSFPRTFSKVRKFLYLKMFTKKRTED